MPPVVQASETISALIDKVSSEYQLRDTLSAVKSHRKKRKKAIRTNCGLLLSLAGNDLLLLGL